MVHAALMTMLGALLVSAGIEDARRREIAHWKNAAIALLAPLWWVSNGLPWWPGAAIQAGLALGVFAFFFVSFQFGWMGGGDVKLLAALALWLPFTLLVWMLTVMAIAGGAVTLAMIADRIVRRREAPVEVPYGVAIAIAGLLSLREPILNHFP